MLCTHTSAHTQVLVQKYLLSGTKVLDFWYKSTDNDVCRCLEASTTTRASSAGGEEDEEEDLRWRRSEHLSLANSSALGGGVSRSGGGGGAVVGGDGGNMSESWVKLYLGTGK
jgi:hypothetical protein